MIVYSFCKNPEYYWWKEHPDMKEKYEELKMEVIAFDGEIFTDVDYTATRVSGNGDLTPGNSQGSYVVGG